MDNASAAALVVPCFPPDLRTVLIGGQWICLTKKAKFVNTVSTITNLLEGLTSWVNDNFNQFVAIIFFILMFVATLTGSIILYNVIYHCQDIDPTDSFDDEEDPEYCFDSHFVFVSDGSELADLNTLLERIDEN